MKNIKSFTLVLLIKGRHEFTHRWLMYMKEIKFEHQIIIADGQDDDETKKMIDEINGENILSIRYYRYNTHAGYPEYFKMKNDILSKVETELVMLCDNDDFILPMGLNKQIIFLSENLEYISSSGRILNFELDNYNNSCFGKKINLLHPYQYHRLEEPGGSWKKYIDSIYTKFQPNFYNVFYVNHLKQISHELVELNVSDFIISEFYIQLRTASIGKSKIIGSTFHYLRQRGTSTISNNYEFTQELLKRNMPNDFRKMITKFAEILNKKNYKEDVKLHIQNSFSKYLNFYLAHTMLKYRFPKLYKVKIFMLHILNSRLIFLVDIFKTFRNFLIFKKISNLSNKSEILLVKSELERIFHFLRIK